MHTTISTPPHSSTRRTERHSGTASTTRSVQQSETPESYAHQAFLDYQNKLDSIKHQPRTTPLSWRLIHAEGALPYFALLAFAEVLDVIAGKIRVDTGNYFNPIAAAIFICLFAINGISLYFPNREIAVAKKISQDLSPHRSHASSIQSTLQGIQKSITARKVQIRLSLTAAAINIVGLSIVTYCGNNNITLSPITPNSPWEAIFVVIGNIIAAGTAMPLFYSIAKHALLKSISSAKLWLKINPLLNQATPNSDEHTALNFIKSKQRPFEYAFRFISNAYYLLCLSFVSAWSVIELCGLLPGGNNPDFWSQTWVNTLEPYLNKAFYILAIITISYGTLKLIRSIYNKLRHNQLFSHINKELNTYDPSAESNNLLNAQRNTIHSLLSSFFSVSTKCGAAFLTNLALNATNPANPIRTHLAQLGFDNSQIEHFDNLENTPQNQDSRQKAQECIQINLTHALNLADPA